VSRFNFCVGDLTKNRQQLGRTRQAKAKIFATCNAPLFAQISNKTEWQKSLPSACRHKYPRRGYPASAAKGDPRGNALAPFFRHFLGRTKKWHQKQSARREAVRASGGAENKKICPHQT
jgi:hypothetical protein